MSTGERSRPLTLLGYAEPEAEFGWKKRTLQEWVRKKKLKRPGIYPGGKAAWHLEDILVFADTIRQGLKGLAVTDPVDPESIELQEALTARRSSKRTSAGLVVPSIRSSKARLCGAFGRPIATFPYFKLVLRSWRVQPTVVVGQRPSACTRRRCCRLAAGNWRHFIACLIRRKTGSTVG